MRYRPRTMHRQRQNMTASRLLAVDDRRLKSWKTKSSRRRSRWQSTPCESHAASSSDSTYRATIGSQSPSCWDGPRRKHAISSIEGWRTCARGLRGWESPRNDTGVRTDRSDSGAVWTASLNDSLLRAQRRRHRQARRAPRLTASAEPDDIAIAELHGVKGRVIREPALRADAEEHEGAVLVTGGDDLQRQCVVVSIVRREGSCPEAGKAPRTGDRS